MGTHNNLNKVRIPDGAAQSPGGAAVARGAKRGAKREAAAQPPANSQQRRNSAWGKLDRPIAKPPANERGPNQRGVCPTRASAEPPVPLDRAPDEHRFCVCLCWAWWN